MSNPRFMATEIAAMANKATCWPAIGKDKNVASDLRSFWTDCANGGLLRLGVPEAFGGIEGTTLQIVEALTELGRVCLDNALPKALSSQIWTIQAPLVSVGTEAQKAKYLPKLVSGEILGALGLTEPESGSDATALTTRAEKVEGGYKLNGKKHYIGMATECDFAIVFASTAPSQKSWGLSAFLIERGDTGFIQGPEQPKIGLSSLPMGELHFKDCVVSEDRRLGPEGAGASLFQAIMDLERSFLFASQVGAMLRQLDEVSAFADARRVFGLPISDYQSVSNRIADMAVRVETCLLMQEKAARLRDAGTLDAQHAAMTKLHISECFLASSLEAVRVHGGAGYLARSQSGADLKDALGGVIYSGTSDVQRNVIARLQAAKSSRR